MDNLQNFFQAVQAGDLAGLEQALDRQPELVGAHLDNGLSAVLVAVYYGQQAAADLLVARGARLDLFSAAALGNLDAVAASLRQDPSALNQFNVDGFQPLGLAAFFGRTAVVAFLLKAGAEVNTASRNPLAVAPLNSAAAGGQLEIVKLLLEHGADVNFQQGEGFTALHAAADNGQMEMVQLLLAAGADLHVRTRDGRTARELALEKGHLLAAELL